MTDHKAFNTDLAREAEQARVERDVEGNTSGVPVKVKVVADHALSVAGKAYEPGATFTADKSALEQALARGLVEQVETKGKRES